MYYPLIYIKNIKKSKPKIIFVTLPHSLLLVLNTDFNFVHIKTLNKINFKRKCSKNVDFPLLTV